MILDPILKQPGFFQRVFFWEKLEVFYLPLADPGLSVPSIRVEMQTIETDHAQLLFLRRLRMISLQGDWTAEDGVLGFFVGFLVMGESRRGGFFEKAVKHRHPASTHHHSGCLNELSNVNGGVFDWFWGVGVDLKRKGPALQVVFFQICSLIF